MNLTELKENQQAVITHCDEVELPLKLMEMGCVTGAEIRFLSRAPLGTPLYYKLGNTRIALGKNIADKIEVKVVDEDEKTL